jgi:transposase-like protein
MVDPSFSPARGYMQYVSSRDAVTLLPIICDHVLAGSKIHSDECAAYNGLSVLGYEHYQVCHKYTFVNRDDGTHTQHIESYWNKQKTELKNEWVV